MTPTERALPSSIDGSRRQRIARGSGTSVEEVNRLLEARKQMEKLMKGMSRGQMPDLGAMMGGQGPAPGMAAPARRKATKSNKKKKRTRSRR
jgi:signal recognition particle subunit SRP54